MYIQCAQERIVMYDDCFFIVMYFSYKMFERNGKTGGTYESKAAGL